MEGQSGNSMAPFALFMWKITISPLKAGEKNMHSHCSTLDEKIVAFVMNAETNLVQ